MVIPRPSRRRGAAASLILGDHPVSSPDSVRHHSSHHLLHPAVPRVVAVTFTTRPAHAHDPVLGVIGECPDPVPDHITARVVAESRPVHARNAVRLYSPTCSSAVFCSGLPPLTASHTPVRFPYRS